jgi:mRNA-degrading endonuclease RelE of RelBE toxin-antitoxin system
VSYQVRIRPAALKQLDALIGRDYDAVARAISGLEKEPRPKRVKKLADSGLWRIRVGSLRIVYAIDDKNLSVILVRIARRAEDTYKNL